MKLRGWSTRRGGFEPPSPFRASPDRAAVLVDFDGTVSNIVVDAADARPAPGAVDVLHRLSDRYGVVAVVSGRPVSFLVEQLGAEGRPGRLVLSGLYGLERSSPDGGVTVIPGADRWRTLVEKAATAAESRVPRGREMTPVVPAVIPLVPPPDDPGPNGETQLEPAPEPALPPADGWSRIRALFRP